MARPTLQDVADKVGVSAKTVSNVVNGTGWVKDDLKQRVREALVEVGYRPNAAARQLRSGRSGMIALAVPELSQPYFAELASELVRAAQERSVTVLVSQTDGLAEAERQMSDGIGVPVVDGLIMSPLALSARELAHRLDTTPLVLLGEHIGESVFPRVTVDNAVAAEAATSHLLGLGRRRIAAIGAQDHGPNETAVLRLTGYKRALEAAGVDFDDSLVGTVEEFHRPDGARAVERMLDSGIEFDAIFAFNDLLAFGAIRALADRGISVPGQVAVIGFDDIEEGRYSTPTLSTVSPDKRAIARAAISLLLDGDQHDAPPVGFSVIGRGSTDEESSK